MIFLPFILQLSALFFTSQFATDAPILSS